MRYPMPAPTDPGVIACAFLGLGVAGGVFGYLLGPLLDDEQLRHGLGRHGAQTLLGSVLALTLGFFALA